MLDGGVQHLISCLTFIVVYHHGIFEIIPLGLDVRSLYKSSEVLGAVGFRILRNVLVFLIFMVETPLNLI